MCNKYRDVLWKIISSLPCNCLGGLTYVIPFSLYRDIGTETYVKLLEQNNVLQEKTSIINLYNIEESTFGEKLVYPEFDKGEDDAPWFGSVAEFFFSLGVISIERTRLSDTKGRYILIIPATQRNNIWNDITRLFGCDSVTIGDEKHTWRNKCNTRFGNNPSVGYQRPYRPMSVPTHNSLQRGITRFNTVFEIPAKRRRTDINNMVIDVPDQQDQQPPLPPRNTWEQPPPPPDNNAPIDDSSAISSHESLTVRTLRSDVSFLTAQMTEVRNQFDILLEANRLSDMKNNKRDENLQNFMTESREHQKETRARQRVLEQDHSTTSQVLAHLVEKLNIKLIDNDTPNDNNHQHSQPQQQQRQHQSHAAITPIPTHHSQDIRRQPHLSTPLPTSDTTTPTSPRSRGTAGQ